MIGTSLIHKLIEEQQTPREFVLANARQMAVLHPWEHLKELPAELPEDQRYTEEIRETQEQLRRLAGLCDEHGKHAVGCNLRYETLDAARVVIEREERELATVQAMLAAVEAWEGNDHPETRGLRRVMLKQLGESAQSGERVLQMRREELATLETKAPCWFLERKRRELNERLANLQEDAAKGQYRRDYAQAWLEELRATLPTEGEE